MTSNTNLQVPNAEVDVISKNVSATGTDTQIMRVGHPDPAASRIKWVKLYIHNTAATAAEVLFWDEDLTAGAISANSKQGANAVATARFRVTLVADSQKEFSAETLPGLWWQAGIAARTDAADTLVVVEYIKSLS